MDLFDWKLTAGQRVVWTGAARYLRLVECVGTIVVDYDYEAPEYDQFRTKLIRGVGVDLSHPDSNARAKNIGFTSPITQTVTVLVSELPTTDSRLSGTVSVIDGSRALVDSGKSFAACGTSASGASTYARQALWNPIGSGKAILVAGVSISSSVAQKLSLQKITAGLATVVAAQTINKDFSSSTLSVAEKHSEAAASATLNSLFWYGDVGLVPVEVEFRGYLKITPGSGIMLQAQSVNNGVVLSVQYTEEDL